MSSSETVAAIQMVSGADVEANLRTARGLLSECAAAGVSVAVLPENFAFMGRHDAERLAVAEEPGDGPVQAFLSRHSRELGLCVVGGTVPLRVAGEERRVASACLVYDGLGGLAARYDKIHLFDVTIPGRSQERYRESDSTLPGERLVVLGSPAGRLGLAVCYDVRFPELFRGLVAEGGAEIVALPAAFTAPTGRAHWEVLVRARAIENQCYVVAAAQGGRHDNGRETWGDSIIVDPWGRILDRLARGLGIVTAEIELHTQRDVRREFPVLDHRRQFSSGN